MVIETHSFKYSNRNTPLSIVTQTLPLSIVTKTLPLSVVTENFY